MGDFNHRCEANTNGLNVFDAACTTLRGKPFTGRNHGTWDVTP
jgi:hypothetical protein